jgi:long-subunit acyl-CoA synthetase (AMP-forming)
MDIGRGDTVALMMGNRPEFYPLEVGAQHAGATSFSVYNTLPAGQLTHIFTNAGNRVVFCEEQYVERIRASGVAIERIVCIDGHPEGTISVTDFLDSGKRNFDFEATWRRVQPEDVLTLIYTSGTTGNPKGVEISHDAMLFTGRQILALYGLTASDRVLSYLPSAHIADRFMALYLQQLCGLQITTLDDMAAVAAALADSRPTLFAAVPRVWEKLRTVIESAPARVADIEAQAVLRWGLEVAAKCGSYEHRREQLPESLSTEWKLADAKVLSSLRSRTGLDAVRIAISGGAPVSAEVTGFFAGLGIPICQNWGMSELGPVAAASLPGENRPGTVGKMLPNVEARLADDGELLVRGPLVMRGYRNDPDRTAEAIDPNGWLQTGDVATIDTDGYITIVDRKKDLIISSGGKNMSPNYIENAVKGSCPLIGAVVVIGDARPYNTALIVLDTEAAESYALKQGIDHASAPLLSKEPGLVAAVRRGVATGNQKLARVEQIKRFSILPVFWEQGGDELTMTMKIKRRVILEKYAIEIETLYAASSGPDVLEP